MERKRRNDRFGLKWTTKPLDGTRFNGATSPMWVNPAPKFYLAVSIWHLILAVGTIAVYFFINQYENDCDLPMKPFQIALASLGIVESIVKIHQLFFFSRK